MRFLFDGRLAYGAVCAAMCANLSLCVAHVHAQGLAMQDVGTWSAFQTPAAEPVTTGPVLDVLFDDIKREGPWRASDQKRLSEPAAQLIELLRNAHWDEALRVLKQQQPDLNQADENRNTPLSLAAAAGQLPLVREMLRQGAQLDQTGTNGLTPLAAATWYGQELVVRDLLRSGARVDAPTLTGQLPLHVACAAGKPRIMAMLVQAGANWRWVNKRGHHAVSEAAFFGQTAALQWLEEHGALLSTPDNTRLNAVHAAALGGHLGVVRWLQQKGVPVPSVLTQVLIEQVAARPVAMATP